MGEHSRSEDRDRDRRHRRHDTTATRDEQRSRHRDRERSRDRSDRRRDDRDKAASSSHRRRSRADAGEVAAEDDDHGNDHDHRHDDDQPGPAPPPRVDPHLDELGVAPLTNDDYFQKAAEFKVWLSESKGRYLDEISSKEARRYFDKFVDRWNSGRLSDDFYLGKVRSAAAPSSTQTRHKWNFASKSSYTQAEQDALASIRDTVDTMTNAETRGAKEAREAERKASKGSGCREAVEEAKQREEAAKRRRVNRDARDLAEELAPRATGRDALIEKRRERNAANRDFANRKDDDGLELDDATLMGGDDYGAALQGKSGGTSRREQARQERRQERQAEMTERVAAMRSKEQDTMAMFKQLAQQRFGGGAGS
ncbi:uncharacterized protein PFL1_01603 [Pseudozyma flocculosa PF-1]|uniref:uncharacterized protein n=1 Tax=Pseudozyma flocculosa PF-1 TaxID=1277687 RepID=UPI0004561358|nr:uncharacterized protein PFL1_01603 [Pseudozyma flocculosa PF-1]EPQ30702.1 hypothetical protein PFL1_01603 [Pseudozyma flocculosa PF-1]